MGIGNSNHLLEKSFVGQFEIKSYQPRNFYKYVCTYYTRYDQMVGAIYDVYKSILFLH